MSDEARWEAEQRAILYAWTSIVTFCALLYLGAGLTRSTLVTLFMITSYWVGFGPRRLTQIGFGLSVLAILVSFGFPSPETWPGLIKSAPDSIQIAWSSSSTGSINK